MAESCEVLCVSTLAYHKQGVAVGVPKEGTETTGQGKVLGVEAGNTRQCWSVGGGSGGRQGEAGKVNVKTIPFPEPSGSP